VVVLPLFVVVAAARVAIPLLVLVVRREDAPMIYARWRAWLAVVLIAKGVVGLLTRSTSSD